MKEKIFKETSERPGTRAHSEVTLGGRSVPPVAEPQLRRWARGHTLQRRDGGAKRVAGNLVSGTNRRPRCPEPMHTHR